MPIFFTVDMLDQMKVHNDKFMAAFANNDPESIGPLYTVDCKVMPTGQDVQNGREGNATDQYIVYSLPCCGLHLDLLCRHPAERIARVTSKVPSSTRLNCNEHCSLSDCSMSARIYLTTLTI